MESQFHYWTEDEIACNFRKMLTLEQYRNSEMTSLYQKVLGNGPVSFIEDLFREMMEQGVWCKGEPKQMAVEFYAPFYLLLTISDAAHDKEEREEIENLFTAHMDRFIEKYAITLCIEVFLKSSVVPSNSFSGMPAFLDRSMSNWHICSKILSKISRLFL